MKTCLLAFIFSCLVILPVYANPAEKSDQAGIIEQEVFETLSTKEVNRFIDQMNRELHADVPQLSLETVKDIAQKGVRFDFGGAVQVLSRTLFGELTANMRLMGKLLFLAVLCALLQNLQSSFSQSSISVLAYGVCFVFLSVIALTAFYQAITIAVDAISYMTSFMQALLPLLLTLLAGVGALTSAALFTPLMLFVVNAVGNIVKEFVLPLFLISAALECTNYIADKYRLTRLTALLKQSGMMILGFTLMLFIGVITVQGITGGVADGLTLRTAKFATAAFVPVVGRFFADAVELVMGASLLIKNAVGVFGVIVIVTICLLPIVKVFALVAVMKLTGALVQPMGDEKMSRCLTSIGNHLLLVAGALLTVALMFFLAVTMIVGVGSMAVMLR